MKTLFRSIALAFALTFSFVAVANAQDPCIDGASPAADCVVEVGAVELEPTPVVTPAVAAKPTVVAGQQQLPVTGGDATSLALFGGGLLAAGAALTLRARRNTASV